MTKVPGLPVVLPRREHMAVAVLLGPKTLSAGEISAVAFHGLKNVRSFGLPTGGALGDQTRFSLDDGSALLLATGVELDRTGQVVEAALHPLHPDERVTFTEAQLGAPDDPVIQAASAWLRAQPDRSRVRTTP